MGIAENIKKKSKAIKSGKCEEELEAKYKAEKAVTDTIKDEITFARRINDRYARINDFSISSIKSLTAEQKTEKNNIKTRTAEHEKDAKEFTKGYKKCLKRQYPDDFKDSTKCKEESDALKDIRKEFNDSCGDLGGPDSCMKTINSCEQCDFSEEAAEEDLNCVLIRNQATCPELANDVLEDMKEEREDYEDKIKELGEDVEEKQEEKISHGRGIKRHQTGI